MAKPTLTVSDVRKAIEEQRRQHEKGLAILAELEAKLEGHESLGKEMKRVTDAFVAAWERRYGAAYAHQGAKDATAMKRLLQALDPPEVEKRMAVFFASDDPFLVRARHGLAIFASTINQHVPPALPLDDEFQCRHRPRCASAEAHTSRKLAEVRQ